MVLIVGKVDKVNMCVRVCHPVTWPPNVTRIKFNFDFLFSFKMFNIPHLPVPWKQKWKKEKKYKTIVMFWFRVQIECRLIHLHTRHIMTRIRRQANTVHGPKIWRPLDHILLVRKSGDEIIIIIKMADDWRRPSINDSWWFYGWERWPDNGFISVSENKQDYFSPPPTYSYFYDYFTIGPGAR